MTNSADPDQLEPADLDLHCLLRQGMPCSAREGLICCSSSLVVCLHVVSYVLLVCPYLFISPSFCAMGGLCVVTGIFWESALTLITLSIGTPYLLIILVLLLHVSKVCCMHGKQCRPWSDAMLWSIWSRSTLFAKAYLSQYLGLLWYIFS